MIDPAATTTPTPPAETPHETLTRQLRAMADYSHENGYGALYRDHQAAIKKQKEQETNGHS